MRSGASDSTASRSKDIKLGVPDVFVMVSPCNPDYTLAHTQNPPVLQFVFRGVVTVFALEEARGQSPSMNIYDFLVSSGGVWHMPLLACRAVVGHVDVPGA